MEKIEITYAVILETLDIKNIEPQAARRDLSPVTNEQAASNATVDSLPLSQTRVELASLVSTRKTI